MKEPCVLVRWPSLVPQGASSFAGALNEPDAFLDFVCYIRCQHNLPIETSPLCNVRVLPAYRYSFVFSSPRSTASALLLMACISFSPG